MLYIDSQPTEVLWVEVQTSCSLLLCTKRPPSSRLRFCWLASTCVSRCSRLARRRRLQAGWVHERPLAGVFPSIVVRHQEAFDGCDCVLRHVSNISFESKTFDSLITSKAFSPSVTFTYSSRIVFFSWRRWAAATRVWRCFAPRG